MHSPGYRVTLSFSKNANAKNFRAIVEILGYDLDGKKKFPLQILAFFGRWNRLG